MIYLMFLFAVALSGAAAFYSIIGLMAIFAASPIPIAVMGSILEGSKLVIASWLYRNWKQVPIMMKGYFVSALAILMFLTSMGIFGFLSKAHLDQGVPTSDIAAKVALIDEKITSERETIDSSRQVLAQLDQQVNQTISRTSSATDTRAVERSIVIRRNQSKERSALIGEIERAQSRISQLNEERVPLASDLRKVEAEVGPIKYIAAVVYGQDEAKQPALLEKAVQWVTILIVAVFDPLAVMMLIAANWSLTHSSRPSDQPVDIVKTATPPLTPIDVAVNQQITDSVTQHVNPTATTSDPTPDPSDTPTEEWRSRPAGHLDPHNPRNSVKG